MRRPVSSIAAVLGCLLLGGCACIYGRGPRETSLLVVNHTGQPISVSYSQEPGNTEANPIGLDQQVLPEHSVRFSGLEGDRLVIRAGSAPEMVLEYAKRSQAVRVTGEGDAVRYEVRKGFSE